MRAQDTFRAVDTATGHFVADNRRDDERLTRTSGWLLHGCQGMWRRIVQQPIGRVVVEFELQRDADAFRLATAADPDMITCQ